MIIINKTLIPYCSDSNKLIKINNIKEIITLLSFTITHTWLMILLIKLPHWPIREPEKANKKIWIFNHKCTYREDTNRPQNNWRSTANELKGSISSTQLIFPLTTGLIKNKHRKIHKCIACCYHHLTDIMVEFSQIPKFRSLIKCCYVWHPSIFTYECRQ